MDVVLEVDVVDQEVLHTIVVVRKMNANEFGKIYTRIDTWTRAHTVELVGASFDEHSATITVAVLRDRASEVGYHLRRIMEGLGA